MAIAPLPIPAMPGAMDAFTAQIAGVSAQTAYDTYMKDEYRLGNDQYIGYTTITTDKPSISGDTSNTIVSSQSTDPIEAWSDAEADYSVPKQTGGLSSGSQVSAIALSLMEKTGLSAEAVVPVAVPIDAAIVAVSQALGVSMDIATLDVETKNAFIDAVSANGSALYDKARNLVTAWKDSLGNILFPKAAVDSVNNVMAEKGIGGASGKVYPNLNTNWAQPIPIYQSEYTYITSGDTWTYRFYYPVTLYRRSGENGVYFLVSYPADLPPATLYGNVYRNGQVWGRLNVGSGGASFTYGGKTVRWSSNNFSYNAVPSMFPATEVKPIPDGQTAWVFCYGTTTGKYPEGTSKSEAPAYTPSQLLQRGSIMGANNARTPVVAINIPDDPYNSTGSTKDPNSTTDDENAGVIYPGLPKEVPNYSDPNAGSKEENVPIPLPIPDTNVSNPDVPLTDASVVNSTLVNELVEELATTLDPQPGQSSGIIPIPPMPGIQNIDPDTGLPDGTVSFPSIVPASGSGFIHVYNPTPGEFVSFGNWLWVTYADATIDKIWNNPFDGVIGAHELYATPNREGSDNIRSGFLTCPTTAALVRNRYSEIDCGTIIVPEFYGNYLDYSPYSQAYIYLPFIGINEVSIDDIVGHSVNVRYRVDSYTGSCIAMIFVAKDGYQNLCYQFAGNCSVEVPLAGGSQAAIKAGVLQAEAYARSSLASAALSGAQAIGAGLGTGGLAGGLMGGLSALGGMAGAWYGGKQSVEAARVANKSSVQHSGQFGASHGAMGEKIPFIIIRNPVQVKVVNYNEEYGYPAHKRVIIGGCTGYLRVREVNVISAHATDEEKAAIEMLLKNGVYIS